MFFSGVGGRSRTVNLRGKSGEKTKQQLLDDARRERDARQRQRLEHLSATCIQVNHALSRLNHA